MAQVVCVELMEVLLSCLKKLSFSEIKQMRNLEVLVPFEFTNAVYHLIETQALSKEFEEYEDKGLRLKLSFEEKLFDTITDSLQEILKGQGDFKRLACFYFLFYCAVLL